MEGVQGFDEALSDEALTDLFSSPLPVTWSPQGAIPPDQFESQLSGAKNYGPPHTSSSLISKLSTTDDIATKKMIRREKDRIRRRKTIMRQKREREALQLRIDKLSKQVEELKGKQRRYREQNLSMLGVNVDSSVASRSMAKNQQHSDSTLIRQYIQELDTVYAQTDNIFKPFNENPCNAEQFKATRKTEGATEYFQSSAKQLVPFGYSQTSQYLWRLIALEHRQEDRRFCIDIEEPENTIAMSFRLIDRLMIDRNASLFVLVVARRYEENDRTVIVWRALTEGEGSFRGMHSDETGWCVVRPSAMDACTIEYAARSNFYWHSKNWQANTWRTGLLAWF
ncbi:unnamed protein product [Phytophthora fragariaefolia]|uniref:Unnamed protein product n=1 Tax=Phytophthora fragariaefolia TaxID=1490495 RepID=A0A9W7CN18_9STRA|nr:unnamed protein product [Phytophthora fragariaefolia]